MPKNFYDLLEIHEDATQEEVKAAWRDKAREYHPDVNDDARAGAQFKTLRTAYEVLSDRTERRAYDRLGHEEYVSTRLDGLPTGGMSRSSSRWNRGTADGDAAGSDESGTVGGSGADGDSGTATESAASRGATDAGTDASGSTDDGRRADRSTRDGRSSASARTDAGDRSGADAGTSVGGGGGRDTSTGVGGSGARNRARSARTATGSTTRTGSARSPLWYGWFAVLTATVAYAAALGAFGLSNAAAVRALAASLVDSPVPTLVAPSGLAVSQFAARAVAQPGVELLFVGGVVVLPVVLALTVGRFGSGLAWLYPLAALGPAVVVLGGAALPPVAALDLALLVVLPVASAVGFLVDVGRFLFGAG